MKNLIKHFYCGNISKDRNAFNFKVTKFGDINQKIITFFKKHPIQGVKAKYFDPAHPLLFFLIKKIIGVGPSVWLMSPGKWKVADMMQEKNIWLNKA